MSAHACNCAYGPSDPRCCIAKARRAELEEAHRLGREGKPLPEQKPRTLDPDWLSRINAVSDEISRANVQRVV